MHPARVTTVPVQPTSNKSVRGAATPSPGSLELQLMSEIGAGTAVAVVPSPRGLLAVSADGARRRTLTAGSVTWALVDSRSHVVWFAPNGNTEVWLLDLMQSSVTTVRVVSGNPDRAVAIVYPKRGSAVEERLATLTSVYDGAIEIIVDDQPALRLDTGIYDEIFEEQHTQHKQEFKKAQMTASGRALLRQLAQRGQGQHVHRMLTRALLPPVRTVPASSCEDASLCGHADAIPGTSLWRVVVEHSCGDACFTNHQLYDPATRQFLDLAQPSERSPKPLDGDRVNVADFDISADGRAVVLDGKIYRLDSQPVAAGQGHGGGWLGGAWHVL